LRFIAKKIYNIFFAGRNHLSAAEGFPPRGCAVQRSPAVSPAQRAGMPENPLFPHRWPETNLRKNRIFCAEEESPRSFCEAAAGEAEKRRNLQDFRPAGADFPAGNMPIL
jgi:hypothetical protein